MPWSPSLEVDKNGAPLRLVFTDGEVLRRCRKLRVWYPELLYEAWWRKAEAQRRKAAADA